MSNLIDPSVDPYGHLGMARNSDGSVTRIVEIFPTTPAHSNPSDSNPVLTKDIPVNESNKTWVYIFLPRKAFDSSPVVKLLFIVYYHGGELILLSAASTAFHEFYSKVAIEVPTVIVLTEYRLAPEHLLPPSYDDCMEALQWIKTTGDEWFTKYADFSSKVRLIARMKFGWKENKL